MNKLLLTMLCALSFSASAQQYGIGMSYDFDSATDNSVGLSSVSKTSVLGGVRGKYGQLDGGVYDVEVKASRFTDHIQGGEIGYGHILPVGKLQLGGRVAFGKIKNRGRQSPTPTATYRTYTVSATYPINEKVSPFISYRLRPGDDPDKQHLYSVGFNYMVKPNIQLQATYRQTRSTGPILNGLTTQLLYVF